MSQPGLHNPALSLELSELPVTQYFDRWGCCDCCKKKEDEAPSDTEEEKGQYSRVSSHDDDDEEDENTAKQHNQEAQKVLISEQCLDQTVKKIVNNLSWVNATLLAVAMKNTLSLEFPDVSDEKAAANNAWIYFIVIFVIGIILAVTPRAFEDLTEMKRELELQEAEIHKINHDETEHKERPALEDSGWNSSKIYDFIEVEVDDLVEKFEDLFIPTLSNTVSMAWRDAAKCTFALIIVTPSATATAYFFYALFMTTFGLYLVIRIGGVYEEKEQEMVEYLHSFDERFQSQNEQKKELLKFAFRRRSIKLTQSVVKFAIAWSWRDCINTFIHAIYGSTDGNLVMQQWGYFITIALFVSVAFSFSDQFHILVPKNASPEEQQLWLTDKSRLIVNDVLYDNLRFVVGMALFDALIVSLESLSGTDLSLSVICLFYWTIAIGGICLSVVGTHHVQKWELRNKIAQKGLAQAMFDTFERLYDPTCALHEEGDADFVPMILDTTVFELVDVTVSGLGIAGSMATTNAIRYTINVITMESGLYDATDPDTMQQGVWVIWLSFLICLTISTFITAYFARMVQAAKRARRKLFRRFNKDDKKEMTKRTLDEIEEEEEEEKHTRKRASTKAEDIYIADDHDAGHDLGGDHGGGDDGGGGDR
eukprot:167281_1